MCSILVFECSDSIRFFGSKITWASKEMTRREMKKTCPSLDQSRCLQTKTNLSSSILFLVRTMCVLFSLVKLRNKLSLKLFIEIMILWTKMVTIYESAHHSKKFVESSMELNALVRGWGSLRSNLNSTAFSGNHIWPCVLLKTPANQKWRQITRWDKHTMFEIINYS